MGCLLTSLVGSFLWDRPDQNSLERLLPPHPTRELYCRPCTSHLRHQEVNYEDPDKQTMRNNVKMNRARRHDLDSVVPRTCVPSRQCMTRMRPRISPGLALPCLAAPHRAALRRAAHPCTPRRQVHGDVLRSAYLGSFGLSCRKSAYVTTFQRFRSASSCKFVA